MSMYSDHNVGALSDEEFNRLGAIENRRERYNEAHFCQNDFNQDECMDCSSYDDCLRNVLDD